MTRKNMRAFAKKGLSPVIATTLLVAIAIVLAMIIFLWAKGVVGEVIQKDGVAIEQKCVDISFTADISSSSLGGSAKVSIQNNGNIPLYGVEVKKVGDGTIESKQVFGTTVPNGDSVVDQALSVDASSGDEFIVIPIIVGESNVGKKQYSCINQGQSVTVI